MLSNNRDKPSSNNVDNPRPKAEYSLMKNNDSFFNRNKPCEDEIKKVESRNFKSDSVKELEITEQDLTLLKIIDDEIDAIQVKVNELGKIDDALCKRKDQLIVCDDVALVNAFNTVFKDKLSISAIINKKDRIPTIEVDKLCEGDWHFKTIITKYITSLCLSPSAVKSFCTPYGILITLNLYERDNILAKLQLEKPQELNYEHAQGGSRLR